MRAPFLLLCLPSIFAVSEALAGGCPTCTTSAECVDLTSDPTAKCVEWFMDFGCGPQRITCCPGQGCNTFSGTPSCVTDGNCRIVDEGVDAGMPDTGTPDTGNPDTGNPGDAGPLPGDAALPDTSVPGDAGSTDARPDTGTSTNTGTRPPGTPRDRPGCGCSAAGAPGRGGVGWLGLMLLLLSVRAGASAGRSPSRRSSSPSRRRA